MSVNSILFYREGDLTLAQTPQRLTTVSRVNVKPFSCKNLDMVVPECVSGDMWTERKFRELFSGGFDADLLTRNCLETPCIGVSTFGIAKRRITGHDAFQDFVVPPHVLCLSIQQIGLWCEINKKNLTSRCSTSAFIFLFLGQNDKVKLVMVNNEVAGLTLYSTFLDHRDNSFNSCGINVVVVPLH